MSARTEIQEILEWISDLTKQPPAAKPEQLPKGTWQLIGRNLIKAAETLGMASQALTSGKGPSPLAEYARDLERQAKALALRARLLAGRSTPKPVVRPATAAGQESGARKLVETSEDEAAPRPNEKDEDKNKPDVQSPDELALSAAKTLENAYEKLAAASPSDATTDVFAKDLDLLAELTLSLRNQIARQTNADAS